MKGKSRQNKASAINPRRIDSLVGSGDEAYDEGRYLITSPIGQGLVGKKVGEVAEIAVPRGTLRYEVLAIRYEDM